MEKKITYDNTKFVLAEGKVCETRQVCFHNGHIYVEVTDREFEKENVVLDIPIQLVRIQEEILYNNNNN